MVSIRALKHCGNLLKVSNEIKNYHCGIVVVSLLWDRSNSQCNASIMYLDQTFDVQLIFKSVRRNKKVYTKCKSKKIHEADSAPCKKS